MTTETDTLDQQVVSTQRPDGVVVEEQPERAEDQQVEISLFDRFPRWFIVTWVGLTLVSLVPIWVVQYFPAQNGPWFLSTVQVFKEISNPQFGYAEFYERSWFPIPHMLYHATMLLVAQVVPLALAEKIVLSLSITLMPLSVLYFLNVVAPDRKMLAILGFLMVYSYPLMRGYNNFYLSVSMFFFTFGYWLRTREREGRSKYFVLGVLSVLVYLAHLIAFLLLVCAIGWYQLRRGAGWLGATRSALAATVCGWPLVIGYLTLNKQSSEWIDQGDTSWRPLHWTVQYFLERFFLTVSTPAFLIAVAAWAWVPVLLILAGWAHRDRFGEWCRKVVLSPLGSLALVLLSAFVVLPDHVIGWHKANQRLIPFILVVMLGLTATVLEEATYRRIARSLVATVSVAVLAVLGLIGREFVQMDRLVQDYTAATDKMEMGSRFLPVLQENPNYGWIRPLTRAYEYYLIERGGGNGKGIAGMNTLSMVWYRHYPESDTFPNYKEDMSDAELDGMLQAYDYVLVWGGDRSLDERLTGAGMVSVHDSEKLRLYANL